ncbi:hypothetical protein MoryE10_25140 [Methylogaea oryzae]|uniref:Uncharacterized protein n=1 Tax=Methylogaea oryzae TaxID=1295382 RepID=A0A8D5AHX3_9GAMM|nr:hypothetical protein MoryE10_25140 [Methylogaea oryzae]
MADVRHTLRWATYRPPTLLSGSISAVGWADDRKPNTEALRPGVGVRGLTPTYAGYRLAAGLAPALAAFGNTV